MGGLVRLLSSGSATAADSFAFCRQVRPSSGRIAHLADTSCLSIPSFAVATPGYLCIMTAFKSTVIMQMAIRMAAAL